jgi:hypothetical protein
MPNEQFNDNMELVKCLHIEKIGIKYIARAPYSTAGIPEATLQ